MLLDGVHKNFKGMFPIYEFRLTIFRFFGQTSYREMLLMTLNAPVTTRSAELYMNGKLSGEIRGFRLVET